jgi:hypothetical protein
MKSPMKYPRDTNEMKYPGIVMKSPMKYPRDSNEIPNEIAQHWNEMSQ